MLNIPSVQTGNEKEKFIERVLIDATLAHSCKLPTVKGQRYLWEKVILIKNVEERLENHRALVLPKQDKLKAMELAHEKLKHTRKRKVLNILSSSFVWTLMAMDAHAHVHSCSV